MSNVKLAISLLFKVIVFTAYTLFILYTAVHQAWITTTLAIFLPLFAYFLDYYFKIVEARNKLKDSKEKVNELMDRILKNQEKMKNRDNKDDKDE